MLQQEVWLTPKVVSPFLFCFGLNSLSKGLHRSRRLLSLRWLERVEETQFLEEKSCSNALFGLKEREAGKENEEVEEVF